MGQRHETDPHRTPLVEALLQPLLIRRAARMRLLLCASCLVATCVDAQLQITQARLQSFSEGEGGAPANEAAAAAAAGLAERVSALEHGRSAMASELEALRQDFANLAEGLQGGQQNIESSLEQTKVSLQKADAAERRALEVEIARVGRERAHSRSPLRAFG